MNRGLGASALLLALVLCGSAWAQDDAEMGEVGSKPDPGAPAPSPKDDRKARELFEEGDAHYKEGRYEEALAALQEAYDLSGRKALLFNMANALEKLGRDEEALAKLEAYAPHASPSHKELVAERIAALRKRIEAVKPPPTPEPPPPPKPIEAPPPPPGPDPLPRPRPTPAVPPDTPAPDSAAPTSAVAGYALLGVGALGLGLGAAFGGLALTARSDAEAACDGSSGRCLSAAAEHLDDDVRFSAAADISFGLGIAAALAGGALVIYSVTTEPTQTGRSTVTIAWKGEQLLVIGRF